GDGGFTEVSGKRSLEFFGKADLRAPHGNTGTLLLDPDDIVIQGGATGADDAGYPGNVTDAFASGGTITITEEILETSGANVLLQARRNVSVSGTFDFG